MAQATKRNISPKTDKAFELWVLIQQTRDAIYNARDKELSSYGISQREAAVLRAIISIGKNATPTRLSRWVYRKPHTVAEILKRMQKKGLLNLRKDTEIQNIVRIELTAKGKKGYKASLERESLHHIFDKTIREGTEQLESCLKEIRNNALNETGDTIHRPFP